MSDKNRAAAEAAFTHLKSRYPGPLPWPNSPSTSVLAYRYSQGSTIKLQQDIPIKAFTVLVRYLLVREIKDIVKHEETVALAVTYILQQSGYPSCWWKLYEHWKKDAKKDAKAFSRQFFQESSKAILDEPDLPQPLPQPTTAGLVSDWAFTAAIKDNLQGFLSERFVSHLAKLPSWGIMETTPTVTAHVLGEKVRLEMEVGDGVDLTTEDVFGKNAEWGTLHFRKAEIVCIETSPEFGNFLCQSIFFSDVN